MSTSIIVPCRNEAGSITALLHSILLALEDTDELIIVEGGSYDATWDIVVEFANGHKNAYVFQQEGKGKFDAVLLGIRKAKSEFIMIWDADGTVSLEDNLRIYRHKSIEKFLITGDRLRGPREVGAMQNWNLVGNWVFALIWGILCHRKPFDTLCGTKKFPRDLLISAPTSMLKKDPYGDFTIIAMTKRYGIPIISLPVDYSARKYGKTNIHRWSGGIQLMTFILQLQIGKFRK